MVGFEKIYGIYLKHIGKKEESKRIIDRDKEKLTLLMEAISLEENDMLLAIDTVNLFYQHQVEDMLNKESLALLSKIMGNDSGNFSPDDRVYLFSYLKNLLLPFGKRKCENESNPSLYLAEFDIFLNLIDQNLDIKGLMILGKYNEHLLEIIKRCKIIKERCSEGQILDNIGITNSIIIENMLVHMATLLYFNLSDFDYRYDILVDAFFRIINNFSGFLQDCYNYGIFQDRINMIFNPENVLNEYLVAKMLLEREYNPPIYIIKK